MYPVSYAFLQAVQENTRKYYWTGKITTKNGVVYNFDAEDIVKGSGYISSQCCGSTEIELGTVYSAEMGITLLSDIDRYTLEDALVELTYHLRISRSRDSADLDEDYDQTVESDGIYEAIPMGVFEVSEANRTVKCLELKAYDYMLRFEKDFNGFETVGKAYDFIMGYTNSSMVAYTKLSPNHSGQRTHGIDRITPHCVGGQTTAEGLGDWFAKKSTQASSNYGIDRDGRVGLYVEEKNRSWCSSSGANDQRAVTIECASDTTEPYAFKDIVYQKLIELCTDICKRNGKSRLIWFGDKEKTLNYEPKSDEMILTVHRWFANKSCPGNWMYARMGDLAEKVTAALGGTAEVPATEVTSDPEKHIWDFLMGKIGNAFGVAGLMGNLYAESGLKSNNLQNSFNKKLSIMDEEYTMLVDGGFYPDFVKDKAGYGLAQWTFWSRKQALLDFARAKAKSIGDLQMQLDFLWKELNDSYPAVLVVLKDATSVREASDAVLLWYERPADQSEAVQVKRSGYGEGYYKKYARGGSVPSSGGMSNADCPFLVRVTVKDLRIRKGNGTDTAWTGKYVPPGVYTIVEVKAGKGSNAGWGRLKSGAGWIALSYAKRV